MFGRRKVKVPKELKYLKDAFSFDPKRMTAVVRRSICTGEEVAGFRTEEDGHFTEVMLLKNAGDEEIFKELFGITGELERIY